jgi:hypothetical protein
MNVDIDGFYKMYSVLDYLQAKIAASAKKQSVKLYLYTANGLR